MNQALIAMEKGILLANWLRDDIFVVAKPLVKITKNISDAVILSRIVWYFTPKKDGGLKLKVRRDGQYWLVKAHEDWDEECCIPKGTAKDSIKRLKEQGYIEVEYHRFGGLRKVHIHLCWDAIAKALGEFFPDPEQIEVPDSATTDSIAPGSCNDGIHLSATTESIRPATTESIRPITSTDFTSTNKQVLTKEQDRSPSEVLPKTDLAKKNKHGYTPELWLLAHNEHKPAAWPSVKTMNGKSRAAGIKAMIEAFGGELEALESYRIVLTWIRIGLGTTPSWWRSKDISFENFVKTTAAHVVSCCEKAVAAGITEGVKASEDSLTIKSSASEFEIRSQHARLQQPGSQLIVGSGFTRQGVTTVWDILKRPAEAAEYLKWLRSQEVDDDDDHPMSM